MSQILSESGVRNVEWVLSRKEFTPREYVVQLNETNYAFVMRLLAEEGIYTWFTHENDSHHLYLTNHVSTSFQSDPEDIIYEGSPGGSAEKACIYDFSFSRSLGSGVAAQRDRYFKQPSNPLQGKAVFQKGAKGDSKRELFRYPGRYKQYDMGQDYTKLWLEAERALLEKGEGQSNIHQLMSGMVANLKDYRPKVDGAYLYGSMIG